MLILIVYTSLVAPCLSQFSNPKEFILEQQRNSFGYSGIENLEGNIVIVGSTEVKDKGSDILLQVVTKKGVLKNSYQLGGLKDEVGRSVVETKDGGYIIAGYTESIWPESKGERDAIIIKLNRQGKVLWHHISGTSSTDEWNKIILLPSGDVLAAGTYLGHPAGIMLNSEGKELWEHVWVQISGKINSACTIGDHFFLTGESLNGKGESMLILKINNEGIIQKTIVLNQFLEGNSIISLKEGNLAIAGNLMTKTSRQDGVIVTLDPSLKVLNQMTFGGRSDDRVNSITELESSDLLVTGLSYSGSKGARRSDLWLELFDHGLKSVPLADHFLGNSQDDVGYGTIELINKSVWVIGSTHPGLASASGTWIIDFQGTNNKNELRDNVVDLLEIDSIWISGDDKILDPDEFGYFTMRVKNNSITTSLWKALSIVSSDKHLLVPDSVLIKSIDPGEVVTLTIPFSLNEPTSHRIVDISVSGLGSEPIQLHVPTRTIFKPDIQLTEYSFEKDQKSDQVRLKIKLVNNGTGFLSQGSVYFVTDFKVETVSEDVVVVNNVGPKEKREIEFTFKPDKNYNQDSVHVQVVMRSDESTILAEKNYLYVVETPVEIPSPLAEDVLKNKPPTISPAVFQSAIWLRPDPEENGYKIEHQIPEIDIRLKIISSIPLVSDSVSLSINDMIAEPGVVYLPESKSFTQDLAVSGYQYTYRNKINLLLGENVIKIVKRSSGVPISEAPLVVDYIPKRYNLHLISIGVPQKDLQFTAKDAGDLAKAFQGQSGKLFNKVFIHLFNTPDSTTTSALRFAIQDIANDYFLREKIQPGDMIILYISSHGFQLDESKDKFRIAASDFNWLYKPQTSLDFKDDIIDVLSSLPCKKLIFLDACYSGAIADIIAEHGAKGVVDPGEISLSRAIAKLVEAQNDFQVVTSSSPGQRSYEDPTWGNSAFMKGILEAITPGQTSDPKRIVDKDGDRVLYLSEIYSYIETRIPEIVLTKKPRPEDIQKPWMMAKEEWPIFVYP